MKIEVRKGVVFLYNDGATSPIDFFRKSDSGRTLNENGYEVSEYIRLLSKKTWMESYDLYKLAVLIQKEFSKNNIDWEQTFFPIEKKIIIDDLFREYQLSAEFKKEKKSSLYQTVLLKLQFGIDLEKESKNEILKRLRGNLNRFGLI